MSDKITEKQLETLLRWNEKNVWFQNQIYFGIAHIRRERGEKDVVPFKAEDLTKQEAQKIIGDIIDKVTEFYKPENVEERNNRKRNYIHRTKKPYRQSRREILWGQDEWREMDADFRECVSDGDW
jgi:hypothetical protein